MQSESSLLCSISYEYARPYSFHSILHTFGGAPDGNGYLGNKKNPPIWTVITTGYIALRTTHAWGLSCAVSQDHFHDTTSCSPVLTPLASPWPMTGSFLAAWQRAPGFVGPHVTKRRVQRVRIPNTRADPSRRRGW